MNNYKFTVNGYFLCRNITGIERFSIEILYQLDKIIPQDYIAIYIPKNAKFIPDFKNIKIIISEYELSSFWKWTQFTFAKYVKKSKTIAINFANECPLIAPGITFIHDIYCKLYPNDFKSFRDRLVKIYSCTNYSIAAHKSQKVLTVSNFSKMQICSTYKIAESKVAVIPNGWDHFEKVEPDFNIINNNPLLQNDFYFTLGSLSKRKNLKWIVDYASKHLNENFAISGATIKSLIPPELARIKELPNVVLLGYVSDSEVKALMSKCKAFIFPSYYEGFGIPPLEALSTGAKVIISNSASLPEIFKSSAYYINPEDSNVSLDDLLKESVSEPKEILDFYTYENAAKLFLSELNKL